MKYYVNNIRMPERKYKDIAHLSVEDYNREAIKRRRVETVEYRKKRYEENKEEILKRQKDTTIDISFDKSLSKYEKSGKKIPSSLLERVKALVAKSEDAAAI